MQADEDRERDAAERLLRTLDHAPPRITAASVIAQARARKAHVRLWRVAATVLLGLGLAGIAWAAPGSPLREWFSDARPPLSGRSAAEKPDLGSEPADEAGIAVAPGMSLVIQFAVSDSTSVALARLVDGPNVLIRAPAGAATFTSEADRVVVADVPAGTVIHVGIPRTAPRVEVRLGSRRVFLKEGASVLASTEATAGGDYRITLGP